MHHERGIISVDEKVHFRAPPKVATLASILRSELEALLLRKIVTPDAQVDQRDRAFVDASRAVRGAVDDFFSGTAYAAPDLQKCPRQVVVTYRERGWNSWMVAK